MNTLNQYLPTLEGIKHQFSNPFFPELTEAVEKLMEEKKQDTRTYRKHGLDKIIKKHTGLNFNIVVMEGVVNAAVRVPDISRDNPIINENMRRYHTERDAIALIKESKTAVKGSIDLSKGRVSGVWTKLKVDLYIGSGLFMASMKMTAKEIAAIVLHEVGHIMTYIETLTHTVKTNYALMGLCLGVEKANSVEERVELLEEFDKAAGTDIEDKEIIAKSKKVDDYQVIVLAEADRVHRNALGNTLYDKTTAEYLADQFAARHGAALHIATAMDKIYRAGFSVEKFSTLNYLLLCIVQMLLVIFFTAFLILFPVAVLVAAELVDPIYDGPEARAKRLRDQLVERMRDPEVPKALRKQLDEEVKTLDIILKTTKDRKMPMAFIVNLFRPKHRKMLKGVEIQKKLEDLANNELYVIHNRLIA